MTKLKLRNKTVLPGKDARDCDDQGLRKCESV